MVVIPQISQKMFYIIIALIAVIGLLFVIITLWRTRRSQKKVNYLSEELEQRKIDLVKRDLEASCMDREKALKKRKTASKKTDNKIENRSTFKDRGDYKKLFGSVDSIETTSEYLKVQDRLKDLDSKEKEFNMKEKKFVMDDEDFQNRIGKFNRKC